MPRGGKGGHKGQRRHFTSPEELEHQRKREEREREWRKQKGDSESEEEDEEDSSEESSSEEDTKKAPSSVIDVENPNRVAHKTKKASAISLDTAEKPQLSRKQREELQKQRAAAHYQKLHAEGKTDEARSDMARLAIIRKQREEAAHKREEEKKAKEAALAAKRESTDKALGKKKS